MELTGKWRKDRALLPLKEEDPVEEEGREAGPGEPAVAISFHPKESPDLLRQGVKGEEAQSSEDSEPSSHETGMAQ